MSRLGKIFEKIFRHPMRTEMTDINDSKTMAFHGAERGDQSETKGSETKEEVFYLISTLSLDMFGPGYENIILSGQDRSTLSMTTISHKLSPLI